jgi:hypothetical protein
MYCSKCGAEMQETALYCPKCGEKTNLQATATTVNTHPNRSTLRKAGAIICIITSIISACLLFGDVILYSMPLIDIQVTPAPAVKNPTSVVFFQIGLMLLVFILSVVSLTLKRPSKIISIALVLTILVNMGIFWYLPSIGGYIGLIFEFVNIIGGIFLIVDSFIKQKKPTI